ncbi:MAG TPA: SIMPL domain-containing protein [Candidatus Paceibacterota bacterium]|nr:SIMPL domain-containing protein [Candidatus Paceibacterota bacterium]HPC37559.1 SIMPL domain-containing protein [Candidatus Paceibacterota bacterium]HRU35993.1 SIMPL domain-containing protein [Candidatus Paceibacterota bacterium]
MSKITSSNFWQCSLGFFLIIASIVALIVGWAIYNGINGELSNSTFVVNGEGKVYAKPDVAVVDMSIINQNIDVEKVQAENDEKTQRVINFLKESGVDEKDIKTLQYNLQPEYDYNWCRNASSQYISYCPPKLVDYILTQSIEVKIRDLNNVGKIIGKLTDVGVNQISSINFVIDEDNVYKSEARKEAVLDAQKRANDIAQTAGIKLGRIITISESPVDNVYPVANYAQKEALMDLSSASPIEIGTNEINASISLVYEIIK